jgi:hypothetical protein
MPLVGFEPSVSAGEDISCRRPRGHLCRNSESSVWYENWRIVPNHWNCAKDTMMQSVSFITSACVSPSCLGNSCECKVSKTNRFTTFCSNGDIRKQRLDLSILFCCVIAVYSMRQRESLWILVRTADLVPHSQYSLLASSEAGHTRKRSCDYKLICLLDNHLLPSIRSTSFQKHNWRDMNVVWRWLAIWMLAAERPKQTTFLKRRKCETDHKHESAHTFCNSSPPPKWFSVVIPLLG